MNTRPRVAEFPRPGMIYFYNATFTAKFWSQVKIYAILI
jgi:hypothetical protein